MFIRTGGEQRISNFSCAARLHGAYFTDLLWPDFDAARSRCDRIVRQS